MVEEGNGGFLDGHVPRTVERVLTDIDADDGNCSVIA